MRSSGDYSWRMKCVTPNNRFIRIIVTRNIIDLDILKFVMYSQFVTNTQYIDYLIMFSLLFRGLHTQ